MSDYDGWQEADTREGMWETMEAVFPAHKASLHLTHNDHKSNYMTVQEYIDCPVGISNNDWISEEEKRRAIETNEMWELQWYPDTPVGCYLLAASSLSALMQHVADMEDA